MASKPSCLPSENPHHQIKMILFQHHSNNRAEKSLRQAMHFIYKFFNRGKYSLWILLTYFLKALLASEQKCFYPKALKLILPLFGRKLYQDYMGTALKTSTMHGSLSLDRLDWRLYNQPSCVCLKNMNREKSKNFSEENDWKPAFSILNQDGRNSCTTA